MMRTRILMAFGVLGAASFLGCGETPTPAAKDAASGAADDAAVAMSEAEIDALAEKQKVCAVTGEPLGSMGTPVPIRVTDSKGADHTVLLCCKSCCEELLSKPDEYLAKLAKAETDGDAGGEAAKE